VTLERPRLIRKHTKFAAAFWAWSRDEDLNLLEQAEQALGLREKNRRRLARRTAPTLVSCTARLRL
jgi:hypothetical protein